MSKFSLAEFPWILTKHFTLNLFFRSVAHSCPTLCDPVDGSTPGLPVLQHLQELICMNLDNKNTSYRDFPGGALVKVLPSNEGNVGLTPGRDLRSHIRHGQKTKTENRDVIVTDSTEFKKWSTWKKILKKNHLYFLLRKRTCVCYWKQSPLANVINYP